MKDSHHHSSVSGRRWWRNGGRWTAALGSNLESVAIYRITLGGMLCIELLTRYHYLHVFYSDEGTLPLRLLLPKVDGLYKLVCIHSYSGAMLYQQALLTIQVMLSVMLILGINTPLASRGSWVLYLSLTLRNTWLNFILDRYFHHLLFYSMFLPLDGAWTIYGAKTKGASSSHSESCNNNPTTTTAAATTTTTFVTPATIAFKLFIAWLYFDAGYGKYTDPLQGWTYHAQPLPALDTYVRHTVVARYVYGWLGPKGLRLLTPCVVYIEMLGVPLALLSSCFLGVPTKGHRMAARRALYWTIGLMCSMHLGIALTMTNTVLLSLLACVAWSIFLPEGVGDDLRGLVVVSILLPYTSSLSSSSSHVGGSSTDNRQGECHRGTNTNATTASFSSNKGASSISHWQHGLVSTLLLLAFICGSVGFETMSAQCNQSMEHIWSTLLHNRWNVFVGAEEYVTWEIAPGRLRDGSIVDVWSKSSDGVLWEMPGAGAPSTSTARRGRWRSFPYLAELKGEDGDALWSYLCREWDAEHQVHVAGKGGRQLLRFNFFMLQADVLPNMGFSATRKRLVHQHDCLADTNFATKDNEEEKDVLVGGLDFASSGEL